MSFLLALILSAATASATPAEAPEAKPAKERKICKTMVDSSSRLSPKKICKTAAEWKQDARDDDY